MDLQFISNHIRHVNYGQIIVLNCFTPVCSVRLNSFLLFYLYGICVVFRISKINGSYSYS